MIIVTKDVKLKAILKTDTKALFRLMKEIYPLAYSHFWTDNGDWYVNIQYSEKNILKELAQEKSEYFFILYKDEIIGNFRIIWDEELQGLSDSKQVKLHRIYLNQKTQGKGIGKKLLSWLEQKAKEKDYNSIWLDAMDAQPQAFQFYKNLGYKYHSHTFLPFEIMHKKVRKMSQVYKKID